MGTVGDVSKSLGLVDPNAGKTKKHAPSLWEQFSSTVSGVVPGAVHLGGLIAKEAAGTVRAGWDFAHGDASVGDVVGALVHGANPMASIGAGFLGDHNPLSKVVGGTSTLFGSEKYAPASYSQGQSFRNTYEDALHPSRFKQASDEGRIFGKVLEDTGNVALLAGGASAALGAAGEGTGAGARLASRLEPIASKVEHLGAKAVDAGTVGPYRLGLRALGKGAKGALELAPESKVAASAARLLDPVLRSEKRLAAEGNVRGRLASTKTESEVLRLRKMAGSDEAFEASAAQLTGLDQPIAEAVAKGLPVDEAFMGDVYPTQLEGYGVRPEVADVLAKYHAGTLDPELAAKIEETTAAMRAIKDEHTLEALKGGGFSRTGGTLNPEQLGTGALSDSELPRLERVRERIVKRDQPKLDVAERKLRRAEAAERVPAGFGRRDVESTVLGTFRRARAGLPYEGAPRLPPGTVDPALLPDTYEGAPAREATTGALEGRPQAQAAGALPRSTAVLEGKEAQPPVALRDLGVSVPPRTLTRGVERVARVQGEVLGEAKAADDVARRAARTTKVSRAKLLDREAGILGRRAERDYSRAQATGDLSEEAVQAQARQAGSSFAAGRRAEQATVRRATAQERLTAATDAHKAALDHIDAKLEAARKNPQNYPARWRPAMEGQARLVEHYRKLSEQATSPQDKALLSEMAADLPLLPDELAARGLDPRHVTTGFLSDVTRDQTASRLTNSLAPERKLAAENQRGGNSDVPTSAGTMARREAQQASYRVHNEVVQGLLEPMQLDAKGNMVMDPATNTPTGYSRSAESVLSKDGLEKVLTDAQEVAQREKPGDGAHARKRRSEAVFTAMQDKGWEAFDPTGGGNGNAGRFGLAPQMVDPAKTAFLKKGSAAVLDNYLAPKAMNTLLELSHTVNSKWKGAVLPFSPRWQIGDAVGNTLMAWVGGGVPPWELYRQIKKVREGAEIPDRVATHGLNMEPGVELGIRDAPRTPRTPIGKAYKGFQEKAFGLNETINKMERSAFYLAKLEEYGGAEAAGAVERAIRESNRIMGDFANLAPWERRWMTQVLPFWSWIRHINRLTGSVAVDNPARLVHMLRLSAVYADDQVDLPDWARGGLSVGGMVIPLRGLDPFGDVMGGPAAPVSGSGGLGLSNFARSLAPAIKLGAAAGFGKNLSREGFGMTSPHQGTDDYGRQTGAQPLLGHPLELLSMAAEQVPILRNLRDVAPSVGVHGFETGPVLRYDTGETRKRQGKAQKGDKVVERHVDALGRQLGFYPQVVNVQQQKAIAARRRRSS